MLFAGQVSTTAGAVVTVNTAEQVFGPSHVLVTVQVTVFAPPQADGADPPSFDNVALQPPEKLAEFNQVV